jgi:CheY-like chemotaxis protein
MKHNVLLVLEENDTVVETIRSTLLDCDVEVRCAADNTHALDILAEWKPGLILIDLSVGGMPTGAFVSIARSLRPDAEVVLVSNPKSSQILLSDGLNITRYIRKPIEVSEVVTLIQERMGIDVSIISKRLSKT